MSGKEGIMTQAEELAELRRWMREDIKSLHEKLDKRDACFREQIMDLTATNLQAHNDLTEKLSDIDLKNEVKTAVIAAKIGVFVMILAALVSTAVTAGFNHLVGKGG
jgi:hypothetical protein